MDDNDWRRLARYYAGEGSPEDAAETRRWLESDPALARTAESLRHVWELSGSLPPRHGGRADRAWGALAAKIDGGQADARRAPISLAARRARHGLSRRPARGRLLLGAAAAVLVVLLSLDRGAIADFIDRRPAAAPARAYVTGPDAGLRLVLVDGSSIQMGTGSRLTVAGSGPRGHTREATVEGIALFKVAPDPSRPFLVRSGGAVTRVLGTEFVVRSYSGEGAVRVAVLEGVVSLAPDSGDGRAATVLSRGQVGQLAGDGIATVIRDRDEFNRLVRWTSGPLEFADRPLSEVLSALARAYGATLVVTDSALASRPVSTAVDGDRLEEVLDMIALVVDARYEQSGDTIRFSSR